MPASRPLRLSVFSVSCGLIVLAIFCNHTTTAQPKTKAYKDSLKAIYLKSYPEKFFIWPVMKKRELRFELENPDEVGNIVTFKPNNSTGLGVGVYMFDLGFELVFGLPVKKEDEVTLGSTKSTDLQLNILSRRWGADVFYQSYTGFYLANPTLPMPPSGVYPLRPDATTENFGAAGVFVFRPYKYSLRSSYTFADRQLKSSGSFVLSGTFNSFRVNADSAILSPYYRNRIGLTKDFTKLNYQTYSIAPGYGHNFIIKKNFFISLFAAIGPALQVFHYKDVNGVSYQSSDVNSFIDGRASFGYSTDKFFCAFTSTTQTRQVLLEGIMFSSASSTYRLLFGFRFPESGFLKHSVWELLPKWLKKDHHE